MSTNGRIQRLWRFFDLVAPSKKFKPETPNMDLPFSVKPDKKLSVQDVMAMTRDRSYGTPFDPVQGIRGGPFKNPNYYRQTRVIDHGLAEYTTVTQSRVGAARRHRRHRLDRLRLAGHLLLHAALRRHDRDAQVVHGRRPLDLQPRFGPLGLRLHRFPRPGRLLRGHQGRPGGPGRNMRRELVNRIPEIDQQALALYKSKPAKAAEFLTGFAINNATTVVNAWWKLGDDLLVKYNRLYLYDTEKRGFSRGQPATPDWWKKAVRAFDILMEPDKK